VEAGTGRVIVQTGGPPSAIDANGRWALAAVDGTCLLFSETEGLVSSFDARSACFAGEAILLLSGDEAFYDTSSSPIADSLDSFSRVLWLPGSGPAAFGRGRGLMRL
jgi:hypothetical protein